MSEKQWTTSTKNKDKVIHKCTLFRLNLRFRHFLFCDVFLEILLVRNFKFQTYFFGVFSSDIFRSQLNLYDNSMQLFWFCFHKNPVYPDDFIRKKSLDKSLEVHIIYRPQPWRTQIITMCMSVNVLAEFQQVQMYLCV